MAVEKWLLKEFARATAKYDQLPPHARPVVTRPVVSAPRTDGRSDTERANRSTDSNR